MISEKKEKHTFERFCSLGNTTEGMKIMWIFVEQFKGEKRCIFTGNVQIWKNMEVDENRNPNWQSAENTSRWSEVLTNLIQCTSKQTSVA